MTLINDFRITFIISPEASFLRRRKDDDDDDEDGENYSFLFCKSLMAGSGLRIRQLSIGQHQDETLCVADKQPQPQHQHAERTDARIFSPGGFRVNYVTTTKSGNASFLNSRSICAIKFYSIRTVIHKY